MRLLLDLEIAEAMGRPVATLSLVREDDKLGVAKMPVLSLYPNPEFHLGTEEAVLGLVQERLRVIFGEFSWNER